ncbi:MAG: hypothetical protein GY773_26745, partial [Actinomycetia bacterium]|nr:hypothetical protein [Actinomycetes bacterium]
GVFNPENHQLSPIVVPPNIERYSTLDLLPDGRVLLITRADLLLFQPKSNRWSSAGQPKYARFRHATAWLPSGELVIVGGEALRTTANDPPRAVLFDPKANSWQSSVADSDINRLAVPLPDGREPSA